MARMARPVQRANAEILELSARQVGAENKGRLALKVRPAHAVFLAKLARWEKRGLRGQLGRPDLSALRDRKEQLGLPELPEGMARLDPRETRCASRS